VGTVVKYMGMEKNSWGWRGSGADFQYRVTLYIATSSKNCVKTVIIVKQLVHNTCSLA